MIFDFAKRALTRLIRTLMAGGIAICLYLLIDFLAGIPVPKILVPLVTAVICAISKYIRDELKVNLPF